MSEERTSQLAKKLEMAANVAIIVAVVLIGFFFWRNGFRNQAPHTIATGTKFALKDITWQSNDKNMVLALSTTCHFCSESAGFYRVLVNECKQRHVRTIAILPQPADEGKSYLQNEGVTVDEVRQAVLPTLEIGSTPTLLLVDGNGVVKSVWLGKLPAGKEKDVIARISPPS